MSIPSPDPTVSPPIAPPSEDSPPPSPLDSATVLKAGIILESMLLVVATLWSLLRGFDFQFSFTGVEAAVTGGVTAGLTTMNVYLQRLSERKVLRGDSPWRIELHRFRTTVILRIVGNLNFSSALILAVLSGVAEEALFRGALWAELARWGGTPLALVGTSLLFAYAHFGSHVRDFPRVACLYVLFGLVFGCVYWSTESLSVVIVIHSLYNFLAFYLLTNGFRGAPPPSAP